MKNAKNTLKLLFASLQVGIPLMIIYAILAAVATFIENDYGAAAARALIYDSWYFNALHAWILLCLIGIMLRYKLWSQRKYASLMLHSAFVIIIIGAGITRFFGQEGIMRIREGESSAVFTSATNFLNILVTSGNSKYAINVPTNINYFTAKNLNETIAFGEKKFVIKSFDIRKMGEDKNDTTALLNGAIVYNGAEYPLTLIGGSESAKDAVVDLGDAMVFVNWGPRMIELPFSLTLDDFVLKRYAGSMSPSSYESHIVLKDAEKGVEMPYQIYMNHTLNYRGYRFFQSSYDMDEKGTILSVNNDPGRIPTYIGYFLLILSTIWVIFAKKGRFRQLGRFLQTQRIYSAILVAFVALWVSFTPLLAESTESVESTDSTSTNYERDSTESKRDSATESASNARDSAANSTHLAQDSTDSANGIVEMLRILKDNSKAHSKAFGTLQVQDYGGRVQPLDTLAGSLVHKITKKYKFLGLSNMQILLGMTIYADDWRKIKMIRISTPKLREIIGVDSAQSHIAFKDLFDDNGEYKLFNYVEEANRKMPAQRDNFDKDLISVDERLNIAYGIFTGQFLKIFPMASDGGLWLAPIDMMSFGNRDDSERVKMTLQAYFSAFDKGMISNDWADADRILGEIMDFQKSHASSEVYQSDMKINAEILLNHTNPFKQLILPYIALGVVIFIVVFMCIFKPRDTLLKILKFCYVISAALLVIHFLALILRWYVAGHAPWSNGYESMLYLSFIAGIVGVVLFRKSYLAIAASVFLAGISLLVAHLGFMDPQITNLVPVLKSYWLNIHVSVITASYGFLGLCFLLGIITLGLFLIRAKKPQLNATISAITAINEMAMILGLFLLCVGNFLGGVWANESWGRYWGWDPKETWSLISIGVYAIILHIRFLCKENFQYVFASASVVGFFSILMTFFGVNYYLSGLHTYAAGDPLPIPKFLYIMVAAILGLIIAAFFKRKTINQ